MKNEQILTEVAAKVWDDVTEVKWLPYYNGGGLEVYFENKDYDTYGSEEQLIFDHDFAKALWGEKEIEVPSCWDCYNDEPGFKMVVAWKHYLAIMVLEDSPIKYLEQFLNPQ